MRSMRPPASVRARRSLRIHTPRALLFGKSDKNHTMISIDQKRSRTLIKLYKNHSLLWDSSHVHYLNKRIRQNAWEDIGQNLNISAAEVKNKMASLLGSYRREKSRQKQSLSAGWKKEVYVSKWFAYDLFSFMRNKNNPNNAEDDAGETIVPEESSQDTTNTPSTTDTRKTKKWIQEDLDPLRSAPAPTFDIPILRQSSAGPSNDPYYTYGQHISNELRKYDPRTLAHVKNAINNIIFEADMGKYQDLVNGQYIPPGYIAASHFPQAGRSPPPVAGPSELRSTLTEQSPRDTESPESEQDIKEVLISHNFRV